MPSAPVRPDAHSPSLLQTLDRVLRGHYTQPHVLAERQLAVPTQRLVLLCAALGAGYGVCLGTFSALRGAPGAALQVLASALKVPLLFVLTLVVSFPSLYVFAALQRLPLDFRNTLRLMLVAILIDITVVASLGPVFVFFAASSTSYPFLLLLNVAVFALGGVLGLTVLRRATRDMFGRDALRPSAATPAAAAPAATPDEPEVAAGSTGSMAAPEPAERFEPPREASLRAARADQARRLLFLWCVVYGVVGAQMGWLLRPFLGAPDAPFEWFRAREDNFLVAVLRTLKALFGT